MKGTLILDAHVVSLGGLSFSFFQLFLNLEQNLLIVLFSGAFSGFCFELQCYWFGSLDFGGILEHSFFFASI